MKIRNVKKFRFIIQNQRLVYLILIFLWGFQGACSPATDDGGDDTNIGTTAALISIAVTPINPSVLTGNTAQLTATATYSDNSTADISVSANWISSNSGTASVSPSGLVTGVSAGSSNVTASLDGITSSAATITVTAGPSNEGGPGAGNQIVQTPGASYTGQVGPSGNSYYQFTIAKAGTYSISLTNLSGDVNIFSYTDNAFSIAIGNCTANSGTTSDSCTVSVPAATIFVKVSNQTSSGQTFNLLATTTFIDEGNPTPIVLTPGTPFNGVPQNGQVGPSGSSYYQVTFPAAGNYDVTLYNLVFDANPQVYSDSSYLSVVPGSSCSGLATLYVLCTLTTAAPNTIIYIKVNDITNMGTSFTLLARSITSVATGGTGAGNQIVLPMDTPSDSQSRGESSYYQVNYASAGLYSVYLSNIVEPFPSFVNFAFYTDSSFTTPLSGILCSIVISPDRQCILNIPAPTTVYFNVQEISGFFGATYTVLTSAWNHASEGATGVGNPVVLTTGVPHNGQVSPAFPSGNSYYQVTLAAGTYNISTYNTNFDVMVQTYSDVNFTTWTGNCYNNSGGRSYCTVTGPMTVYVNVGDWLGTHGGYGTSYTLLADAPVNESLVTLTHGNATNGQVATGGNSKYQVTFASAGTYTITMSNIQIGAFMQTYLDNGFTIATGNCSSNTKTTNETCTVSVPAGGTIYIKATPDDVGNRFTLTP